MMQSSSAAGIRFRHNIKNLSFGTSVQTSASRLLGMFGGGMLGTGGVFGVRGVFRCRAFGIGGVFRLGGVFVGWWFGLVAVFAAAYEAQGQEGQGEHEQ